MWAAVRPSRAVRASTTTSSTTSSSATATRTAWPCAATTGSSGWQVLSYRQLHEQASRRATEWARQGVKAGAKVCLLYSVGSELLISLAAALGLGACISFLPPQGRRFIARRLAALAPDHVAAEPHQVLLLEGFEKKLLKNQGQASPAFTSHTYKPAEPVGLLFSPLVEPPGHAGAAASRRTPGAGRWWTGCSPSALVPGSIWPRPATTRCSTCRPSSSPRCCAGPRTSTSSCRTSRPTPRCSPSTRCARSASPRRCGTCCCAPARSSRTWPTGSATPRSPSTGWPGAPG